MTYPGFVLWLTGPPGSGKTTIATALTDELRRRGLEPIVTLHHYTNPLWLAQKGGWVNPLVVERFARFAWASPALCP